MKSVEWRVFDNIELIGQRLQHNEVSQQALYIVKTEYEDVPNYIQELTYLIENRHEIEDLDSYTLEMCDMEVLTEEILKKLDELEQRGDYQDETRLNWYIKLIRAICLNIDQFSFL